MHLSFRKITLLCILCLLSQAVVTHVFAAQAITPVQWQQLTTDKAFGYRNDIEAAQLKPGVFEKSFNALFVFFGSKQGNILLWIIVMSMVAYVVYKVFLHKDSFLFGRNKKLMANTGSAQADEKDITTTDWEKLLHNAVNNNDLRLAVRYSYMRLLQILQQHSLIQYRIDKTNYEYYTELKDTVYKQPFRQLSCQYEYTWYGRFVLTAAAYNDYKGLFDHIKKQLGE